MIPRLVAKFGEPLLDHLEESFEQSFNKDVTFSRNTQRKKNLRAFAHSLIAEALIRNKEHTSVDPDNQQQRRLDFTTFPIAHVAIHRCFLTSMDPVVRRNFLLFLSQLAPKSRAQQCFQYHDICFFDTTIHSFIFLVGDPDLQCCVPICLCGKYHGCYRLMFETKIRKFTSGMEKHQFYLDEIGACLTLMKYSFKKALFGQMKKRKLPDDQPDHQIHRRKI